VRHNAALRAVQVAVDAALGEVARQTGGGHPQILREARSTGIAAGEGLLRRAQTAFEEQS
jgi:hypothetical protein